MFTCQPLHSSRQGVQSMARLCPEQTRPFSLIWEFPIFIAVAVSGDPPFYSFGGPVYTLTSERIAQLESGLWYVNITSFVTPSGRLRGQILSVPEPSVISLLGLGIL